jgi:hypothetical protein
MKYCITRLVLKCVYHFYLGQPTYEKHRKSQENLLQEDRKRLMGNFIDNLLNRFTSSEEEKAAIKLKHTLFIKAMTVDDQIDSVKIAEFIELVMNDFAMNGRQIRLKIEDPSESYRFVSVEISGLNQNGEISTWNRSYNKPFPHVIETDNWWWKESISIEFKATNGMKSMVYSGSFFIPQRGSIWAYVSFWLKTSEFAVDNSYPVQS